MAKKFNVLVTEFAVGMGPKIFGVKKGDTEYSLRVLPLGGFCKMEEEVEGRNDVISFNDTTPFQRIIICVAGPLMNFILAFVIMIGVSLCLPMSTTVVMDIAENSPAQMAGLEVGDKVINVNGHKTNIMQDFSFFRNSDGRYDDIVIKRDGKKINIKIKPEFKDGRYLYGISMNVKAPYFNVLNLDYSGVEKGNFIDYITYGYYSVVSITKITVISFVKLFTSKIAINELSGPIGVTTAVGQVYSENMKYGFGFTLVSLLNLTVLLSANLGVLNLLPLPSLDGGRIVVSLVEIITRKRVSRTVEGYIHFIGFILLMALGVYIAFNDILKIL